MTTPLLQDSSRDANGNPIPSVERNSQDDRSNQTSSTPAPFVAIIEPVGGHGGMHFYDRGLCSGLLAGGCRVSLYTCDETQDPDLSNLNFYPSYRGIYNKTNRILRCLRYIACTFATLRHVAASSADVCHFHTFNDVAAESIVMFMADLFRMRIVLTVHDVDSLAGRIWGKKLIARFIYQLADRIIVHNMVSKQELVAIGVPSQKITIIPHGHYLNYTGDIPSQAIARGRLGIEPFAKVILFFGQIKHTKGLDLLLEALPKAASKIPNILLLIAGRPWKTDITAYESLIEKLNVKQFCRLHIGFVPDQDVATYYSAADVVALPYRRIYQSGVLLMAMSYSRTVVVSNLPGMTEIVADGINGYVFTNGSADALADTLVRALTSEQERKIYSKEALEYIMQHHDWDRIGESTASLYRDVIKSRCLQSAR